MNPLSTSSTRRWRAFVLLAVAYFMTIALPAIFVLLRHDKVSLVVTESAVGGAQAAPAPAN